MYVLLTPRNSGSPPRGLLILAVLRNNNERQSSVRELVNKSRLVKCWRNVQSTYLLRPSRFYTKHAGRSTFAVIVEFAERLFPY